MSEPFASFVHALNYIEKRDAVMARNLERSLDLAWKHKDGPYYGRVIGEIVSRAEQMHEATSTTGERTA